MVAATFLAARPANRRGRARIALTGRGYAVSAACGLCAAGGWLLGYPELLGLSGGCVAALLTAVLSLAGRSRLDAARSVAPAKVARRGAAVGTLSVVNAGRAATRALSAADRIGDATVRVEIPALARGAVGTVAYRLPTSRRGWLPVGPLLLRTDDPLGLLRRVLIVGDSAEVLVRPRTAPLSPPPSGSRASLEGPTAENAPSGTATFHTLREYVPGDDLRHVHWRTTARTNTLMVKHLVDSALPESAVVLDTRASSYRRGGERGDGERGDGGAQAEQECDFDIAVDAAATIAAAMAALGYPVLLLTTAGQQLRAQAARGVDALLDRLALLEASESVNVHRRGAAPSDAESGELAHTVERARHGIAAGGALAVVTGLLAPLPARRLAATGGRFERTLLLRARSMGEHGAGPVPVPDPPGVRTITVTCAEEAAAAWQAAKRR